MSDRLVYDSGPQILVGLRSSIQTPGEMRLTLQIGPPKDDGPDILSAEAAVRVIDALQKGLTELRAAEAKARDDRMAAGPGVLEPRPES